MRLVLIFGQPGYETDLLYLAELIALCLEGAGSFSIDRLLSRFKCAASMQAAAKALGVNQSTAQRRLAEFEECIGRRLVHCAGAGA
jgi:hypothetical protein